jgi:hypothetical protein
LPLPDKPSIAVLPFENISGDPEQEYFGDGMVEEIITALSRMKWLFVIARNSSFIYKADLRPPPFAPETIPLPVHPWSANQSGSNVATQAGNVGGHHRRQGQP